MKHTILSSLLLMMTFSVSVVAAQENSIEEKPVSIFLNLTYEEASARVDSLFSQPFFFKTYTGDFLTVDSQAIKDILTINSTSSSSHPLTTLTLENPSLFHGLFALPIERSRQDTVLTLNEDRSRYSIEGDFQDGYSLDEQTFLYLLGRIIEQETPIRAMELPMHTELAQTYIADGERKTPLTTVGIGTSDFSGSSSNRVHNIRRAMESMNGLILAKDDIFSFNEHIGEVDGSTGYTMELVIKGAETIPEYGGGVCQVSSTIYRAALQAGFPIVERKPHSYAVSYYEPWGSDATIYPGVVDLRFANDLPDDIIIHTYIDHNTLIVHFYGTPDGRVVALHGPNVYGHRGAPAPKVEYTTSLAPGKRVWKAYGHNGFSAWWERSITSSTGAVMTERINSVYEARPGAVLEGAPSAPEATTVEEDQA